MYTTKRISSICNYLIGNKLADIGTDHCFLPIYALKSGKVQAAIATDMNDGPLERGRVNVAREGLLDKIDLRLGDGFSPIIPGECDCATISGMGGMLITGILERGFSVVRELNQLILSPQSDHAEVRRTLHNIGFEIFVEDMIKDGEKFYPIIIAHPSLSDSPCDYCDFEYEFGKLMLERPNDVFFAYLDELRRKNENIMDKNPLSADRRAEFLRVNEFIENFCKLWEAWKD